VANYEQGDTINIFGFSRGAYTARSLAGLVTKVGILRKKYISDIDSTYHLYKDTKVERSVLDQYAENFCHPSSTIQFLGVVAFFHQGQVHDRHSGYLEIAEYSKTCSAS
jgi:uncharacterized protein (DUF2235 family)